MVTQWFKNLVRRQRIARYRRREAERDQQDRRQAEHLERVREGIKDSPPQAPPGP
ncbi:MAG TPA: hypothetical protein VEX15_10670 [Nocardioidaceae bacterium]|nr:hypothetical protein [Nocardioidaceae bacterium]